MTDPSKSGNPAEVVGAGQSGWEVASATNIVETAITADEANSEPTEAKPSADEVIPEPTEVVPDPDEEDEEED